MKELENDTINMFLKHINSKNTRRSYKTTLNLYKDYCIACDLDWYKREAATAYFDYNFQYPYSDNTRKLRIQVIKHFMSFYNVDLGDISMTMSKILTEKNINQFLTDNETKFSKRTVITYRINLNQYLNFIDEEYDDLENIINYKEYLESIYKARTVKNKLRVLHVYYAYLEKQNIIDVSPFYHISFDIPVENKEICVLSAKTIKALEDHMIKETDTENDSLRRIAIRNCAITELILTTGLKLSELCNLKKSDLDCNAMKLHVKTNNNTRILSISSKCIFLIKSYMDLEDNADIYLFCGQRKRLSERSVERFLEKISKELNTGEKFLNQSREKYI